MATPPENDDANHSNAPLNFRHSNSLITTKVPHYPTKVTTGMSIIPGWNRPNANGQNANINDKDYNGPDFKARPLKHWRKQLQVYNYNGPANNSRTATISELDRPGTTVYHFTPDCTCVSEEGGNSYIISNNKFGYETKDDDYSKGVLDVKVQNNGFTVVPYYATTAQINDPTNQSAYKIMTGIYNTNCINCSPQGNLIRSGIAFQSQAFFSYSNDKLETRCQTYEQNISTNKALGCVYFDAKGIPLWPTDTRNGPQVVAPVNYQPTRLFNKPCLSETIYKPSNVAFAKQGAVSGSTRLKKLVSDTTMMNGSSFYSARGAEEANLGRYQGTNLSSNYYVKTKPVVDSCRGTRPTPPILSVVGRDTYSITFSWQDFGNSLCNIVYYTVTYFAINIVEILRNVDDSHGFFNSNEGVENFLDNYNEIEFYNNYNTDNTETMVMGAREIIPNSDGSYTDTENNIRYTIISEIQTIIVAPNTTSPPNIQNISEINELPPSTTYKMSMTGTNGNGTSIRSNFVIEETLPDSKIVISIVPLTIESGDNYVYPYNASEPIVLTVKVSSLHTMTPIILRIINATNSNVPTNSNVDPLTPIEGSLDTYEVKLENAGTFNLQGRQARVDDTFGNSKKISPLLTITKATPIFSAPWDIFRSSILLIGKTYLFFPLNIISSIQLDGQYKIINVDGTESNNATFINIDGVQSNTASFKDNFGEYGTKILIKSYGTYGKFRVKATSIETQNYKSISTTSDNIYVSRNDPIIEFKFPDAESFIRKFTYRTGQIYDIEEINSATIISPAEPQSDVRITYSAISLETETTSPSDVASIDARTVTILNAGSFRIRAQTNQTYVYNSIYIDSPPVTIDKATPIFAGPWYLFQDIDTVLFLGKTYTFNPPVFEYPYPGPSFPSASIFITSYTSSNTFIATLNGSTTMISIVGEGLFTITATTSESRNYKKVDITSEEIVSTLNTARVAFPSNFQTNVTYGEEYILKEADFIYPKDTYNFEGSASLSGSKITVSLEQYNYFIIGRRVTANITGTTSPPITSIDDTITDKKIEYISAGLTRHVIYIRNDTRISASTPATITNIIQYISSPRDFFITYSIVSATGSVSDVARISGTTVTLLKAGTFKIIAHTNQTNPVPTLMNSTKPSPLITVNKATPVLQFNNLFTCKIQLITGSTYNFNRANITSPNTIPDEILPITYISLNPDIVTIVNGQPTVSQTPSLSVKSVGSFRIRAQTPSSDRYNVSYVDSPEEFSTSLSMPLIKFDPNQNFGPFTYRDAPFTINEVIFRNPIERHEEIEVRYSIVKTNVVSLEDITVTIHSAGEFTLRVKTIPSANFTISNILEKNITIQRYTPQFEEGWVAFINTNNVNYLMIGQTFEINPPTLISPDPIEDTFPSELRSIQYTIEPERRAEIVISETSTGVKVLEEGGFYIYARTTENSKNYNVGVAKSRRIYGTKQERPLIVFPNNNQVTEITYGDDYSLDEAVFVYPSPIRSIEGTASLSVTSTETRITLNSLQYSSIVIGAYLRVTTTSSNIFNFIVISTTAQTPVFTVVVGLIAGESPSVGSYTVQNMIQEMRIPVGGSIAYSIVPPAPILPSYVPVATILGTNVTIKRAGSFIVQAIATVTNVPPTFTSSSSPIFSTVNVKRATPTVSFFDDNLFPDQVLFTGRIYNFTPAVVTIPSSVTYEELEIEYRSEPQGVVTILPSGIKPTTISIQVNKAAPFRIIAQTLEPLSGNFNRSVSVYSSNIHSTEIKTPLIFFPDEVAVTNLTYGFTDFGVRNVYNVEQPAQFRHPYLDNIPTDLTINYRINVDSSTIAKVEMKNIIVDLVDSDIQGTTTIYAPVITILRPGEFTLIAETKAGKFTLIGGTVPTVEFKASQPIYRKFNVQKATATFEPWYLFPDDPSNPLLAGQRRTFAPPVFRTPIPLLTEFNPSNFTYNSSESRIASTETTFANSVQVLTAVINRVGQFQLLASLPETTYYNAVCVRSENQYSTNINRPIIHFPTNPTPTTVITYGDTYTLSPAYFYYPKPSIAQSSGLYITHFARSTPSPNGIISTHAEVVPGTSPNYIPTVKILSAGTFYIIAQTNVILNKFEKTYIYLNVRVNPATPTISFPGNIFPGQDILIVGTSYDFLPATVTIPSGVTDAIPQIRYKTNDASIATITTVVTLEGAIRRRITILKPSTVPIQIIAYTEATNNFTAAQTVYSNQRSSYSNIPLISAPSINGISITNTLTYGQIPIPTLVPSIVSHPRLNTFFRSGISVTYESTDIKVATIIGTTITLLRYGTFKIIARTVATGVAIGVFKKVSMSSPTIEVKRATPTINKPWNPIPNVLFIGDVATITPPVFTFPAAPVPSEILPITYSYDSATAGIITITQPNTLAIRTVGNTGSLTTTTMRQLSSGGNGDVLLGEILPTLVSPNNVVNTIRVTIPNGISVVPYLYENVSAYGQNPAGAGVNRIRNCSVYSPSEVGTSIIPDNIFDFFSFFGPPPSFTYNDMIITPENTNACGVGTNPILHYIDLWLPSNQLLTLNIQIFEGSNLVPSATYRRDSITTGGATITVSGQPMLPFRIYASDIVSAQGVSENYIRPFNSGATQFRIRVRIDSTNLVVPINNLFPNMPIMTVNMSSTDNIISNNSGITAQITTSFADTTVTNNTSYRFGFLPLGITNPNQAWIQTGTLSFWGGTRTQYTCSLENVVSSVRINNIGRFKIRATTKRSDRYESTNFYSSIETSTTLRIPVMAFPSTFSKSVTFDQPYTFNRATFIIPLGTPDPATNGVTISYSIVNPNPPNVATASGLRGETITIFAAGTFRILAKTTTTGVLFDNAVDIPSPIVTVSRATPTFQTPWNAFPTNTANVPIGTQLTITPPQITTPSTLLLQQQNGFSIVYFIGNAVINGLTVTPPLGTFTIRAETRSNNNYNIASITSSHTITVFNPIPPRIVLNGETLVFQETSLPVGSPTFMEQSPRGFPEWFAVVNNNSRNAITNYARGTDTTTFRPPGQTFLVPFNNIVTTLMTDMNNLFSYTPNFNSSISSWDTRNVTNMSNMFSNATSFNQDLNFWDTSRVIDMSFMFIDARGFNSSLSWNTSQVTSMAVMFMRATSFNQTLNFNTQNVNNMSSMFSGATSFQGFGNIGVWNTSRVTSMNSMFQGARSFSQSLGWDTSRVRDMNNMFNAATAFNGNIGVWNTSQVTVMSGMFGNATNFNQEIGRWNTSQVTNMSQMFDGATRFNQNIDTNGLVTGAWITSAVTNMSFMFRNAQQFNQNIGNWNTSQVTDMQSMFQLAQIFNNGRAVEWRFNGFINQDENNRFFIPNIPPFRSIPFNQTRLATFRSYWIFTTLRQTMNWNTSNVRNMNNMFDQTANFFNVDLRLWSIRNDCPTSMFRNFSPMPDQFTPFQVGVAREGAGYT